MCDPATALGAGSLALSALGLKDTKDARKEAKTEKKNLEVKQKALKTKEQTEKFAAKKREYSTQRETLRRGNQRGRMSTILDKSGNLG